MKRQLLRHGPVALLCAVAVFAILNISAWYNLREGRTVCRRQGGTRLMLQTIQQEIESYKEQHKVLPQSLNDLTSPRGQWSNPNGPLADEWGHPFVYQASDTSYDLFSFGRDGQPGGVGLDADLYSDRRNAAQTLPTFTQYFGETDDEEVDRGRFTVAGLIAGFTVVLIVLDGLKAVDTPERPRRPTYFIGYGLGIVLISSLIGAFLMPLHIPSGH